MSTKKQQYFLYALAFGLLHLPATLWAQESEEEGSTVEGEIEFGIDYLSDDTHRFGKFSGHTEDGPEAIIDFHIESRPDWDSGDMTSWELTGSRLGLDSRRLEFEYSNQGVHSFSADYREIPNNRIGHGFTPYQGVGTNFNSLPSDWTIAPFSNTTSGFLTLDESLSQVSIETKRQRLDLEYTRILNKAWNLEIEYRHEIKDGERTIAGMFGNTGGNPKAVILPAPVDYLTDIVEANFEYSNNNVLFGFGFHASWFDNDEKTLGWENAFGQRSGWAAGVAFPDGVGQMALEPDNSFIQLRANGAINLGASTRISAVASFGTMEQDDPLLPYTINPVLNSDVPLPRTSADAEIDTTNFNLRLTSQPLRGLSLRANFRYDDRDNTTPQATYQFIGGDSQDQKGPLDGRINLPYSYTEQKSDLIVGYRLAKGVRLKAGVKYADYSRTFLEVLDSDEFTHVAGLKVNSGGVLSLSLDYEKSDRDISNYQANRPFLASTVPGGNSIDEWENHPLIRKYFLTDREREQFRLRVDVFPSTKLNLGFSGSFNRDDYDHGFFGLNEASIDSWTFDAGYYPRENISLTGFYSREEYESSQSSRSFANDIQAEDPDRDWFAQNEDEVDTYNIALNFENLGNNDAFELGVDYTYSDAATLIKVTANTIDTLPLPVLRNEMSSFSVHGKYRLSNDSAIKLGVEYAKLTAADFSLDQVVPDTLSNILLLGEESPTYDVTLVSLSYSYRF